MAPRKVIITAAAMGGNVRAGLEDSLYDGRQLTKSNADQVRRIRGILDGFVPGGCTAR